MRNRHLAAIPLAALLLTACASATDTVPLTDHPNPRTHRHSHPDPRRRGLRLAEPPRKQLQQRRRLL